MFFFRKVDRIHLREIQELGHRHRKPDGQFTDRAQCGILCLPPHNADVYKRQAMENSEADEFLQSYKVPLKKSNVESQILLRIGNRSVPRG